MTNRGNDISSSDQVHNQWFSCFSAGVRDVSKVEIEVAAFPVQTLKLWELVAYFGLISARIGDIF